LERNSNAKCEEKSEEEWSVKCEWWLMQKKLKQGKRAVDIRWWGVRRRKSTRGEKKFKMED